jgi:hypothetical protein
MRRLSAPGADGLTWRQCRVGLADRIAGLADRLRQDTWRPGPVRFAAWPSCAAADLQPMPTRQAAAIAAAHGVPLDRPIILTIGRAGPVKSVGQLIGHLAPVRDQIHLVAVVVPFHGEDPLFGDYPKSSSSSTGEHAARRRRARDPGYKANRANADRTAIKSLGVVKEALTAVGPARKPQIVRARSAREELMGMEGLCAGVLRRRRRGHARWAGLRGQVLATAARRRQRRAALRVRDPGRRGGLGAVRCRSGHGDRGCSTPAPTVGRASRWR